MGAKPAKTPPLLPEAAVVTEYAVFCSGDILTVREYNLYGTDAFVEARTFSIERDGKLVVVLYMEFPYADEQAAVAKIIVAPEGEFPREVTYDELVQTYPTICALVKPRA